MANNEQTSSQNAGRGASIRFYLNEDGSRLRVGFQPRGQGLPINGHWVRQAIAERGFGDLFLNDDAIAQLVERYNSGAEEDSALPPVAERRDASIKFKIDKEKMEAQAYTTPPYGGEPLSRKSVLDALSREGIVYGILDSGLDEVLKGELASAVPIARGRVPVDGEDARFESLIPEAIVRKPSISDRGTVDYRDLGDPVMVKPGDAVMRKVPATPGVNGENVLGQVILAKPGQDIPFSNQCSGVAVDDYDPNVLVATIPGQPVIIDEGVQIEDTFKVKDVDLSTGNLNFDGSIQIKNDVKVGMRVRATGDITIHGSVEAASIESDGNIVINGGVIGYGEVRTKEGKLGKNVARLKAAGSVSCHFIQNAAVDARAVNVTKMIANSEVTATHEVLVGKEGSKVGNIIGGVTRATTLVRAEILGSQGGTQTRIELGVDPYIQEQLDAIGADLEPKKDHLIKMVRLITKIKENPKDYNRQVIEKAQQSFQQLKLEITQLTKQQEALKGKLKLLEEAKVVVGRKIYPGVEIRVGEVTEPFTNEVQGGTFVIKGDRITRDENAGQKK